MKVLVTGASGFIGRALSERLIQEGDEVRVLARSADRVNGLEADVVAGDITDPAVVDRACDGREVVFHVAGSFREPGASDESYRRVNSEAVGQVIAAARRHGVRRVIHTSTVGIHGNIVEGMASEDSPIRPEGSYEVSKAEGDALALSEARKGDPEVVVLRPAPVYGPGDTRLLKLFHLAGRSRPILFGDGEASYHLVYISDLVDAFLLAAERPEAAGQAFLIAGAERPSLNELVREVAHALGRPAGQPLHLPAAPARLLAHACEIVCRPFGIDPPLYRRRLEFFTNNRRYDISKASRLLGYAPRVSLHDGLADTVAWYRKHGLLPSAALPAQSVLV